MASEILTQLGAVSLPLAVVTIFYAHDASEMWFFWGLTGLAVLFLYGGYRSFKQAIKLGKKEADDRKRVDDRVISLLTAIAEKQGVDTKKLSGEGGVESEHGSK